mgnify:CR=1 FL=1
MELLTIKDAVKEVLEECPKSRKSDKILIIRVFEKLGFKIYIDEVLLINRDLILGVK